MQQEPFFSVLTFHTEKYPEVKGFDIGQDMAFGILECYNSPDNIEIVLVHGEIYNANIHRWVQQIWTDCFETVTIFPVRAVNPETVQGKIWHSEKVIDDIYPLPELLSIENGGNYEKTDLKEYIYRQMVYEFIWESKSMEEQEMWTKAKALIDDLKKQLLDSKEHCLPQEHCLPNDFFWIELLNRMREAMIKR